MTVRLSLDATNVQREKLIFELVEPFIPGFSVAVDQMEVDAVEEASATKRKSAEAPKPKAKSKTKKKK